MLRRHLAGGAEQGGVDRRSSKGLAKPEGDIHSGSTSRPLSRDVCRFAVRKCDRIRLRSGQGDRALEVDRRQLLLNIPSLAATAFFYLGAIFASVAGPFISDTFFGP